jgi:hypothetical protein
VIFEKQKRQNSISQKMNDVATRTLRYIIKNTSICKMGIDNGTPSIHNSTSL